jgi:hypothetical protein
LTDATPATHLSLLEEAQKLQAERRASYRNCQIRTVFSALSDEEKSELKNVLENKLIDSVTIASVLKNRNFEVSKYGVGRHRRHECACS